MDSTPEVEAKLALPGPVYWRLRDDPGLLGLAVVSREVERQANLFYDTPEGALRRIGAVLRARKLAHRSGVEWTLKSGRRLDAGIQTADEVTAWGPGADDALAAAEALPPVATAMRIARGPLRVDAASSADRLLLEVAAPSGGRIGVSLDRLRIPGDPVFVDYELEAEAHGAARSEVEALAADLAARFGLSASSDSKRARIQAYVDGHLGPPRETWRESPRRIGRLGDRRSVGVAVCGTTGSPASRLAEEVQLELSARSLGCEVSLSPDDWSRAGIKVWVGSSIHWRCLRLIVRQRGGDTWKTLERFAQQVASDRRELEWRWREADLVVLADEPSVTSEPPVPPPRASVYRPDDLPRDAGGEVRLEETGDSCRLTFVARVWPADLAGVTRRYDIGAPVERVAETLEEIGYERSADSGGTV